MQRWIEKTNRDRSIAHDSEQVSEVVSLKGKQFGQGLRSVFLSPREDHLTNFVEMIEEHMLGSTKANAFGTESDRCFGIVRFGIGSDV